MLNEQIYPIRIATPFAVGDVYAYLIHDEKTVLVDCGHRAANANEAVKGQLEELGLAINDIDEIWLTHGHPDHFGQAAELAEVSGAVVFGHPKERANFAGNNDGELFQAFFLKQGVPEEQRSLMIEQLAWLQQFQVPLEPEWIEQGDILTTGRLSFTVRHTPGHAPGHVVYFSDGILFGGDVLLEHISTNALINFDPDTGERNKSLLQYRNSLQWIRKQKGMVLPGHGKFIGNTVQIADHHLQEHRTRYKKILRLLKEESYPLFDLSLELFPDAIKNDATFLVLSEVMGYLDWGMEEGKVVRQGEKFIYNWK